MTDINAVYSWLGNRARNGVETERIEIVLVLRLTEIRTNHYVRHLVFLRTDGECVSRERRTELVWVCGIRSRTRRIIQWHWPRHHLNNPHRQGYLDRVRSHQRHEQAHEHYGQSNPSHFSSDSQ